MATDRELLELAARAAGVGGLYFWNIDDAGIETTGGKVWNPLTDDGDALRLAVKMRIKTVHWDAHGTTRANTVAAPPYHTGLNDVIQFSDGDDYAAARRAIVRAAAEIGRAATNPETKPS